MNKKFVEFLGALFLDLSYQTDFFFFNLDYRILLFLYYCYADDIQLYILVQPQTDSLQHSLKKIDYNLLLDVQKHTTELRWA